MRTAYAPVLPGSAIVTEAEALHMLSHDLFTDPSQPSAGIALQPRTTSEVAAIVVAAERAGHRLAVRGGGMSYTDGYAVTAPGVVLLDMRGLNAIRHVFTEDRTLVAEAGCTWAQIGEALAGTGLRTKLKGPISGIVSTLGGAASQNLPGELAGILGLEVVVGGGATLHTGSWGRKNAHPFFRHYGPDLTGLFIGDNGAFGIKTAVALALESVPKGVAHASFGFATMQDIGAAMVAVAQTGLAARMFGLDPLKTKSATKVDLKEGLATLKDVALSSAGGLGKGLVQAAKIGLAGKDVYSAAEWSLHLTFEGETQETAERAMERVSALCLERGVSVSNAVPVAMYARPYSIRGFLGPKGERWVPLHGIFPFSAHARVIARTEAFFAERRAALEAEDIAYSFMLSAGANYFLIEPMFYWQDAILPLHAATLGEKAKSFVGREPRPQAQVLVRKTRLALRDEFESLGAVSAQIGRFYRYADAITPEVRALYAHLRSGLDPRGVFSAPPMP
jgi:D-lactate dehydrogenase (cytochrome)